MIPGTRPGSRLPVHLGALAFLALLAAACGDNGSAPPDPAAETIDRETFVATYVDLRLAALEDTTLSISPAERERVLRRHGVTRDDLFRFVEVHGDRVDFMRDVWDEVDERIRRAGAEEEDTTSSRQTGIGRPWPVSADSGEDDADAEGFVVAHRCSEADGQVVAEDDIPTEVHREG